MKIFSFAFMICCHFLYFICWFFFTSSSCDIFRPKTLFSSPSCFSFFFRKWALETLFCASNEQKQNQIKSRVISNFFPLAICTENRKHFLFAAQERNWFGFTLWLLSDGDFSCRTCNCYENNSLGFTRFRRRVKIFFHRFFPLRSFVKIDFSFFSILPSCCFSTYSFSCQFSFSNFIFVSTNENWFFNSFSLCFLFVSVSTSGWRKKSPLDLLITKTEARKYQFAYENICSTLLCRSIKCKLSHAANNAEIEFQFAFEHN